MRTAVSWAREVMATLLLTNMQFGRRRAPRPRGRLFRPRSCARLPRPEVSTLIVEDTLHAPVEQARAAGHTWAEIGEMLHVSRQAAFQRFGGSRGPTA